MVYALLIGFFVIGKLKVSDLPGALLRAAITSSVVGALIAFAPTVTFLFTVDLLPLRLSKFIQSLTSDPFTFTLLVMLMLVVVGMFIESNATYIMLVPLFAPIALNYGIDPLWFGFLFVLNLVVGMLTPPVGVLLFVVCGITRVPMGELVRNIWPFILLQYAVLILCLLFRRLSRRCHAPWDFRGQRPASFGWAERTCPVQEYLLVLSFCHRVNSRWERRPTWRRSPS